MQGSLQLQDRQHVSFAQLAAFRTKMAWLDVHSAQAISPQSILVRHQQNGACAEMRLTAIWTVNVLPVPKV